MFRKTTKFVVVLLFVSSLVVANTNCNPNEERRTLPKRHQELDDKPTCGYDSCPIIDSSKLNVHIIAHSHDDVGWLKTVDQYYYGTRKHDSMVGVQYIYDSLIPQLVKDRNKRFVVVEVVFFSRWWHDQKEHMRDVVRQLVSEGRLEFINGGWCMNDEGTVSYQSTIEQMTLGLKFLNETFGSCAHPKVGWQIDPFGHTNEQASLFAQFGFDGMFFSRIDFDDKLARKANKSLDILWHGDRALSGQSGSIFTNIFTEGYDSPNTYCFDVLCLDDSLVDNEQSYEYNLEAKGSRYVQILREQAKMHATNQLLMPMGGDFQYSAAGQNFKNLDKLFNYVRSNAGDDINIFYSTPSCYQKAVHHTVHEQAISLPEKYDDFMPYLSAPTVSWSGYFSSRPSVKLVERFTANWLQVTRFISLANLLKNHPVGVANEKKLLQSDIREHENKCLLALWESLSELQHHDAISGTEKQHVSNDYVRRTSESIGMCTKFIGELRRTKIIDHAKKSSKYDNFKESGKRYKLDAIFLDSTMLCPLLNISQCDALESSVNPKRYPLPLNSSNKLTSRRRRRSAGTDLPQELQTQSVLLNVYNPLAHPIVQHEIRLPCNGRCDLDKIKLVHLSTNESMKVIRLPLQLGIIKLPFREAVTRYEVLFYANIPALGYTSFVIEDENDEEILDDFLETSLAGLGTLSESSISERSGLYKQAQAVAPSVRRRTIMRGRRVRRDPNGEEQRNQDESVDYFTMQEFSPSSSKVVQNTRQKRDEQMTTGGGGGSFSQHASQNKVSVKFDMNTGMIIGLKRLSDGSQLNITQRFGYYFPANSPPWPGAYIFRPNTSEPYLLEKPINYKMFKRHDGSLIEIHQKWSSWIWQIIRIDSKKNYIEFDYVVGPVPVELKGAIGREIVSRYETNLSNNGAFLTDSNSRQLMLRHRPRYNRIPENTGAAFYPVTSTIMMKNSNPIDANTTKSIKSQSDTVAILVDRAQAGASLNEGQLELLIHRRLLRDDSFGVGEPLNEPGEDGQGLVVRGTHRLYLKFQDQQSTAGSGAVKPNKLFKLPHTPRFNLDYEQERYNQKVANLELSSLPTYLVHDQVINDLRVESVRFALKPTLTFDRLRVSASELVDMLAQSTSTTTSSSTYNNNIINNNNNITRTLKIDLNLLNATLPANIHLLTLQPWSGKVSANQLLLRLENLDNPITVHPFPDYGVYQSLIQAYKQTSDLYEVDPGDSCQFGMRPRTELNVEYLIKRIRIVSLDELNLGANERVKVDKRLNWTDEGFVRESCRSNKNVAPTVIELTPREIRTFLAKFEFL